MKRISRLSLLALVLSVLCVKVAYGQNLTLDSLKVRGTGAICVGFDATTNTCTGLGSVTTGTLTINTSLTVAASASLGWSDGYWSRVGANSTKFWNGTTLGTTTQLKSYAIGANADPAASITAILTPRTYSAGDAGDGAHYVSAQTGNNGNYNWWVNFKTRAATTAATTAITTGDAITQWFHYGADGTNYIQSSGIIFGTEGTIGANRVPGTITFYTHPNSTSSVQNVLTLDSAKKATFQGSVVLALSTANLLVGVTSTSSFNTGEIGLRNNTYYASWNAASNNTVGLIKADGSNNIQIGGGPNSVNTNIYGSTTIAATFSSTDIVFPLMLTSSKAGENIRLQPSTGTNAAYIRANTTGSESIFGVESSVAATTFTGSTAYATIIGNKVAVPMEFYTNSTKRLTIASDGAFTFNGVALVNTSGKIPALTSAYFASLDGATITGIDAANVSTGTFASGRLSGSYTGITGVGTLTAGTWQATVVGATYGGTGLNTSGSTGVAQVSGGTWSVTTTLQNAVQDNITRTGTVTSGTWSGLFGAISGANLTTLNATNISSGVLAQARLGNVGGTPDATKTCDTTYTAATDLIVVVVSTASGRGTVTSESFSATTPTGGVAGTAVMFVRDGQNWDVALNGGTCGTDVIIKIFPIGG